MSFHSPHYGLPTENPQKPKKAKLLWVPHGLVYMGPTQVFNWQYKGILPCVGKKWHYHLRQAQICQQK